MPRGDGTGPIGLGRRVPRGVGQCNLYDAIGVGFGYRRGFRGNVTGNCIEEKRQRQLLTGQKELGLR